MLTVYFEHAAIDLKIPHKHYFTEWKHVTIFSLQALGLLLEPVFGSAAKMLLGMPASQASAWFESRVCFWFSFLLMNTWEDVDDGLSTWVPAPHVDTYIEFQAPDVSLAQPWMLWNLGSESRMGTSCLSNKRKRKF